MLRGSRSLSNFHDVEDEDDLSIGKEKSACACVRKTVRRSKTTTNSGDSLDSRVDAPQKPNCRSLMQGLELQGLRRHLASHSSIRTELQDGDSFFAAKLCPELFSLVVPKRSKTPIYPCGWRGKEEGKGLPVGG